jgi:hypothetical protein
MRSLVISRRKLTPIPRGHRQMTTARVKKTTTLRVDDAYNSSNGDRWQVLHDPSTGRTLVRHVPNASSGGTIRDFDIDEFLRVDGPGPEYAAVRRLIEKRADR